MTMEEMPITQLPPSFFEAVAHDLPEFGVGFLRVEDTPRGQDAVLLGSGTLVIAGGKYAILTAHHVLQVLPKTGRLGLILSPSLQRHTVETQGLVYREIARGFVDADGPDLGAVILPAAIASAIAAKKVFYNLDKWRDELLNEPPDRQDGVWFVNGFVAEKTIEEPSHDRYSLVKNFCNFTGAGGPDNVATLVGEYDYYSFPVSYDEESVAPESFGGMSGGGLWQIPFFHDENGKWGHKKPLLSGVIFYQEPTRENQCAIKCHGRISIYKVAYEAITRA